MVFVIKREREIKGEMARKIQSRLGEFAPPMTPSGMWETPRYWDGKKFVTANRECKSWKTRSGAENELVRMLKSGSAFSDEVSISEI